jgi:hypothetical protein
MFSRHLNVCAAEPTQWEPSFNASINGLYPGYYFVAVG